MYFRERGLMVQLLRSQYDPDVKRPKQEIVGRMPRRTLKAPEDVLAKLSPAEQAELNAYIDRAKHVDQLRLKLTAHDLPRLIWEATRYAEEVTDEAERDLLRLNFADAIMVLRNASKSSSA